MQSPVEAPQPLPRRVLETFVAPRRLAAGLRHHAPWFGVLLISTLVAALSASALPEEFFLEQTEDPVDRRGRPVTVTSPPEEIVRYGRYLAMISALVGHPMIVFAVAGLVALIFTVLGGGEVSFRRYLSLTSHAFLIPALGALLLLGWNLLSGERVEQLSLAALLDRPQEGEPAIWWRALESLDLFTLWMLGVLALGVGVLDRKRSFPAALAILLGIYLLLSLGMAMIGGA